ncbi:response regulator [Rathayibacter oskolensis]|uniref:response regulator n=1 Tax=Rathayibacter TaxID=33886 RepID=UPI0013196EFA|nr:MULTISPECIES: response regulator [Rathayibacter]QHC68009.1 response regulator [Rathayibacter sp. VKM Ac-2759]WKK72477.1 response regulator [Rathayibacter oskolensis]
MTPGRALVVDDDVVSRLVLSRMLRRSDWVVDETEDVPEALAALAEHRFDLVVADYRLPSGTGVQILEALAGASDPPPFVLVTGILEYSSLPPETVRGVRAHLTKPVSSEALRRTLESVVLEGRG